MKLLSLITILLALSCSSLQANTNLENDAHGSDSEVLAAFQPEKSTAKTQVSTKVATEIKSVMETSQLPPVKNTEIEVSPPPQVAKVIDEGALIGAQEEESKIVLATTDEAKIPVFKSPGAPAKVVESGWPKLLVTIGILGCLILGTIVFVRQYKGKSRLSLKESTIKVISQHHLGPKKSMILVSVAGESMLVGVTDRQINLIKSVTLFEEELDSEKPEAAFNKQLIKAQNQGLQDADSEDFQMSGLKDVLKERFRTLRKLS
ncbi:MAG: hypothetical protein COT74_07380 [Bdellovibrionales bacterium CG10_big_fil_rev_8_21_14_0_10_45_34]|nr:MAG: hypothetical protein COT74_07380 [Bdellovibrionales bacterium CG10_big_fil_rev_8_21_14_0_10_45_34]